MEREGHSVGKSIAQIDAGAKVTGRAQYTGDLFIPGMLVGKVLRSPLAHARILNIDVSKARRVAGVRAVVTYEDSPPVSYNSSNRFQSDLKFLPQDRFVLDRKVRFVSDRVAAVAAVDEDAAQEALWQIRVEYEELPAVFHPEKAMEKGAPVIHDSAPDNVARRVELAVGNVEEGFRRADCVFENRYATQPVQHSTLETHASIADASDGKITIWSSTQVPFMLRHLIAHIFRLSIGRVRVIKPYVGGAFGGKDEMFEEALCVLLSQKAGFPVLIEHSREEEFYRNRRHPAIITLKTGVTKQGEFVARYIKAITNTGGYASAGPKITFAMGEKFAALYRSPNCLYEGFCVYTNTPPSGAFRGYGNPQSNFALESQNDEIAEKLGIDPVDFRMKNHIRVGDIHPGTKAKIYSCGLDECLSKGAELIGWEKKGGLSENAPSAIAPSAKRRGKGVACAIHGSSLAPYGKDMGAASVRLNEDGSANLVIGSADTGQGSNTVLAQIAAETLGIPVERVIVSAADTEVTPLDIGNCGSRSTFVVGNAVRLAAEKAREELLQIAAEVLGCRADELEITNGAIANPSRSELKTSVGEVAYHARYTLLRSITAEVSGYAPPHNAPPFAAVFAEVEVDVVTGRVEVLRLVAAQDVGRAINPSLIEGQINGAAHVGLGFALGEDLIMEPSTGRILNANFLDYGLAGPLDMPALESVIVESMEPMGPYGAKSVGEVGSVPVGSAIVNAVYDAVGVRIDELPITPGKILKALGRRKQG
jgi:xanthine dehydrogenase molybdenum-binding subunit